MAGETPNEQWSFFAVYDGHGGTQAADLCSRVLHNQLAGELRRILKEQRNPSIPVSDDAIADALTRTFQTMDDQLHKIGALNFGCTATVALGCRSGSRLKLHVANVGDSRALAINARGHFRMSLDHRPSDESEARRIRQEGGFVQLGRVSGVLAVSRALGDHSYKGAGVTWRPSISVREAMGDTALVIASDGLWDFLEDGDVKAAVDAGAREQMLDLAPKLVADATHRGSTDNICCLVIFW
jgi:serine/threonine protein phosphatase PrpC